MTVWFQKIFCSWRPLNRRLPCYSMANKTFWISTKGMHILSRIFLQNLQTVFVWMTFTLRPLNPYQHDCRQIILLWNLSSFFLFMSDKARAIHVHRTFFVHGTRQMFSRNICCIDFVGVPLRINDSGCKFRCRLWWLHWRIWCFSLMSHSCLFLFTGSVGTSTKTGLYRYVVINYFFMFCSEHLPYFRNRFNQ